MVLPDRSLYTQQSKHKNHHFFKEGAPSGEESKDIFRYAENDEFENLSDSNVPITEKTTEACVPDQAAETDSVFSAFAEMKDEDVVQLAQNQDKLAMEYLLTRYKNFVRSRARRYFLVGADHEDIVQEGMIGLYNAIRDYQPERLSSFHAFAELCITRQIITAIKTATRQKHGPLNNYISLNSPMYEEDSDRTLLDVITENDNQNPEEMIVGRENLFILLQKANTLLSPLEQQVLFAYLDGKTYQEMAALLNRGVKTVDNALQRVKHKLEKLLEEERSKNNR